MQVSKVERVVEPSKLHVEFEADAQAPENLEESKIFRTAHTIKHALKRQKTLKVGQRLAHPVHGPGAITELADNMVSLKFDMTEAVHSFDVASLRKLKPMIEDAHLCTANTLFDMVDTDR